MEAKFKFFERVKIANPAGNNHKVLKNAKAVVFGKSEDENGTWYYRLKVDNHMEAEYLKEDELESLGTFAKRENYYSGESIRVGVTKDGEGYIIENKE